MKGKIIDGRLVVAGNTIINKDGGITTNPKAEQLIELGYKDIEYTEKPTYDIEEQKLQEIYTDGDKITVSYEIVALTDIEHNAIIQQEIVAEENKITARNIREGILGDNFATQKLTEIESNIYQLRQKLRTVEANEE